MVSESAPLLRVVDLVVEYERRARGRGTKATTRALDGISLELHTGETLGVVGESGCGKSTLVRTILGLVRPTSGSITFMGHELTSLSRRELATHRPSFQVVFQDPYSSLDPRFSVFELVAEPLRIQRRFEVARVHELLTQVGLDLELCDRKPGTLSGGQRQRVSIARALALQPELLILDEPVSALDVSVQAQILNLLEQLQEELGLAYIFVSHDLSVVRRVSQRVAVMYSGRIVEIGPTERLFSAPDHPYTQTLLASRPSLKIGDRAEQAQAPELLESFVVTSGGAGCAFRSRCMRSQYDCALAVPVLIPADDRCPTHRAACFHPGPFGNGITNPLLSTTEKDTP
jgi:oligopeptide/dipeptide ABC transporter ATP-binding protein